MLAIGAEPVNTRSVLWQLGVENAMLQCEAE